MKDEIRQNGQVILSSDDGISIPMIYNNLIGVNMQASEYRDYLKHTAMERMGFVSGRIEYFRNGRLYKFCTIPNTMLNHND